MAWDDRRMVSMDAIDHQELSHKHLGLTSLLLSCTSLGMNGERIDWINFAQLPNHAKVYDMVYSHSGTLLVREASAYGLMAVNGLGMLVAQGELAFKSGPAENPLKA